MLDSLFPGAQHVQRLHANPLGALFDPFADFLVRRGCASSSIHALLRAAERFGYCLGSQHATVAGAQVTKVSAHRFLDEHLPTCSCPLSAEREVVASRSRVRTILPASGEGLSPSIEADVPRKTS